MGGLGSAGRMWLQSTRTRMGSRSFRTILLARRRSQGRRQNYQSCGGLDRLGGWREVRVVGAGMVHLKRVA